MHIFVLRKAYGIMKRISVLASLGMLVAMMAMVSCQEKGTEVPEKEAENINVTVLVGNSTKEVIEGTVTVTFKPSGKKTMYEIGAANETPDKTLYQNFFSDLKLLFGEERAKEWWEDLVSIGGTLTSEKGDTSCVISKDFAPKAGLSLTDADKYDCVLAIVYTRRGRAATENCSIKGMNGQRFADWCQRKSEPTSTYGL